MKKLLKLVTFCILVFAGSHAKAQEAFTDGTNVINLGIGFGSSLYSGIFYSSSFPAISASYEHGIVGDLIDGNAAVGLGGYVGIAGSKYDYNSFGYNYGWRYTYLVVGARGTFHYQFVENLDTYAGVMLGVNIVSVQEVGDVPYGESSASGGFTSSGFIGGRYYFSEQWAGMLELGYGVSYLNIGAAYRF